MIRVIIEGLVGSVIAISSITATGGAFDEQFDIAHREATDSLPGVGVFADALTDLDFAVSVPGADLLTENSTDSLTDILTQVKYEDWEPLGGINGSLLTGFSVTCYEVGNSSHRRSVKVESRAEYGGGGEYLICDRLERERNRVPSWRVNSSSSGGRAQVSCSLDESAHNERIYETVILSEELYPLDERGESWSLSGREMAAICHDVFGVGKPPTAFEASPTPTAYAEPLPSIE